MPPLSSRRIAGYINTGHNGRSTAEQGKALESLVCYVFGKVPGVSITHRDQLNRFRSEELDVALWNERRPRALDFLPNVILVEAKNWSSPAGSAEVSWFDRKLESRGLDFGILVAMRGITGNALDRTAAHQVIAQSLARQRRVVVITGEDLSHLASTAALVRLLKVKLCELAVTGTLFP
jgi:hypothetical protein